MPVSLSSRRSKIYTLYFNIFERRKTEQSSKKQATKVNKQPKKRLVIKIITHHWYRAVCVIGYRSQCAQFIYLLTMQKRNTIRTVLY